MDFVDLQGWAHGAKTAFEALKTGVSLLPSGKERDQAERALERAEEALKLSDYKLAKELGYRLCTCTFPPQIMLWRESENALVCPNQECGRRIEHKEPPPSPRRRPWLDTDRW